MHERIDSSMEPMHPVFTLVPLRSYSAYVKSDPPALDELMCALMVDPLEAEDAAAESGMEMPHALANFASLGRRPYTAALQTIAQWVEEQEEARPALRGLMKYNNKLGTWCACQLARASLLYVSADEPRPRAIIELTESWLYGKSTLEDVRRYANRSMSGPSVTVADMAAVDAAANAAYSAYNDTSDPRKSSNAAEAADSVAVAVAISSEEEPPSGRKVYRFNSDSPSRKAELVRLREVVAAACLTFPL